MDLFEAVAKRLTSGGSTVAPTITGQPAGEAGISR